ncbi:IS1-like element transposase [Photorhabdus cinerea]|uniref:Insertion element IS1 protein InsA helix-turn-helix domain-containing protein n=1 Tax=Photorhabdus cinerea TaxID=471575 RepID=A0A7X5QHD1_9GAMM|nr:IS1-like element transposase [Photorhabdus cinerea]NHB94391.1 hypothetical protein [Photorhabdus cinerea]
MILIVLLPMFFIKLFENRGYRCYVCCKVFQLEYTYQAYKLGIKEQVVNMVMNNGGIRDTTCGLKIVMATIMKTLKNLIPRNVVKLPVGGNDLQLICEMDDQ